jgi:hypothetical protein
MEISWNGGTPKIIQIIVGQLSIETFETTMVNIGE